MNIDFHKLGISYSYRQKFYQTKEWKSLREFKIRVNPICEMCLEFDIIEPAAEIDHIVPIKRDPTRCLDINNLQSLCKPCHSRKTMKEEGNNLNDFKRKMKEQKPYKSKLWDRYSNY